MTTWILLIVLCAAFALYIAAPLWTQNGRASSPQFSSVDVRRDVLQTQKRELRLDRETGKIDDAEFRRLNLELELEESVAATRSKLRQEASSAASVAQNAADELALEAEILIARARNRAPHAASATSPDDMDAALGTEIARARARNRAPAEAPEVLASPNDSASEAIWTCSSCAREMNVADRFCASCGASRPAAISQ